MRRFEFSGLKVDSGQVRVVKIPIGISSKDDLLACFGAQLLFPEYFSKNWDSFEECLGDLSWLPAGEISVAHADIPLLRSRDLREYLDILRSVPDPEGKLIRVFFPEEHAREVEGMTGSP
jgi:hypothetical protein